MNAGDVVFNFKGDDKDLKAKTKSMPSTFSKIGSGIKTGLKVGVAAIGTATAAVGALVGKSVQAAGELEQQIGGTEAVFKGFASEVQEQSKKAFSTMGLSANDYMATINKMGSLMQGSGLDIKTSMDLSSKAMQRAADVASIMGIDMDSAMESIAGAAKGNFTMMDNLGVAMNATNIESYALSKGIKKSYNEMTQAEKVGMAMQMFLEKTAYATGNYTKENETFAGSLQTMKASFENFISGATDVQPLIDSVVSFGTILVQKIIEMTPQILNGIVQLVTNIAPMIPPAIMKLLPMLLDAGAKLLLELGMGFAKALPTLIPQLVDILLKMVDVILDNLPLFVEAGLEIIMGLTIGIIDAIPQLLDKLPDIVIKIVDVLTRPDMIAKIITTGGLFIIKLVEGLIKTIPKLLKYAQEVPGKVWETVKTNFSNIDWGQIGKDLVQGLINGVKNMGTNFKGTLKGLADKAVNAFKEKMGIHSPSKVMFEMGEYVDEGYINGIDSMQKEIDKAMGNTFSINPQMYGTASTNLSQNVNVVVNNNMEQDPLGLMVNTIKTMSGGAKNDYNYGMGVA